MNLPSKVLLSYLIPTDSVDIDVNNLLDHQKALLSRFNEVIINANPTYLITSQIQHIQTLISSFNSLQLSQQEIAFIENTKIFFGLRSTTLDEFAARFQIQSDQVVETIKIKKAKAKVQTQKQQITTQEQFDTIFFVSSLENQIKMYKLNFAKTSYAAMTNKDLYFSLVPKYQICQFYQQYMTIADHIFLIDELLKNKQYINKIQCLCTKEILYEFPTIGQKVFQYIIQKKNFGDQLFDLRKELDISDKDLYSACFEGLISRTQQFTICDQNIGHFYSIFDQFMTKDEFQELFNVNQHYFVQKNQINTINILTIIGNLKFQADINLNPKLFFVLDYEFDGNVKFFANNMQMQEIKIYYGNEQLDSSVIDKIPTQIIKNLSNYSFRLDCKNQFVYCLFKLDDSFYEWSQQLSNNSFTSYLLEDAKILIHSSQCKKLKYNNKILDYIDGNSIDILEFTDQHLDVQLLDIFGNITNEIIYKPTIQSTISANIDFTQVGQSKLIVNNLYPEVVYNYKDQRIQKIIDTDLNLELFITEFGKKKIIHKQPLPKIFTEIDLSMYELFYVQQFEAVISGVIEGKIIQCSDSYVVQGFPCLCKIYSYINSIDIHLFNQQCNLQNVQVSVTTFQRPLSNQSDLLTDKNGLVSIKIEEGNTPQAIEIQFQYLEQLYKLSHTIQCHDSIILPLLNVSKNGTIKTFIPDSNPMKYYINNEPLIYKDGTLQLNNTIQSGEHALYVYNNNIRKKVARVNILEQSNINDELLHIIPIDDNTFAVSKCDISISGIFSNSIQNFQLSSQNTKFQSVKPPQPPHFNISQILHISEEQKYNQLLAGAFTDSECTATFAAPFPSIFIKEKQVQPMQQIMQAECMNNCVDGMQRQKQKRSAFMGGANFSANRMEGGMSAPCCFAAPGGYMARTDEFLEISSQNITEIQHFAGPDLALKPQKIGFQITEHANYNTIQLTYTGHTAILISLSQKAKILTLQKSVKKSPLPVEPYEQKRQNLTISNFIFSSSGTTINTNNHLARHSPILKMLYSWHTFNIPQKIFLTHQNSCVELMLFIKLNDFPFFESYGKVIFTNKMLVKSVMSAFILDDLEYLDIVGKVFWSLNPIEQFFVLFSQKQRNSDNFEQFIALCDNKNEFDESDFINQCFLAENQLYQIQYNNEYNEMEFYSQTDLTSFSYCDMFKQLLTFVRTPNFSQMHQTQYNILVILLWNQQWKVQKLESEDTVQNHISGKLLLNGQSTCTLNRKNTIQLQIGGKFMKNLNVHYQIYNVDIIQEHSINQFDLNEVEHQITLAEVYPKQEFSLFLKIYQNELLISTFKFEVQPNQDQFNIINTYQTAQINCIEDWINLMIQYPQIKQKDLCQIFIKKTGDKSIAYQFYLKLLSFGIFNPWLLRYSDNQDLVGMQAIYLQQNSQDFVQMYKYTITEQLPFIRERCLKNEWNIEFQKFILRSIFNCQNGLLFTQLVKHGYMRYAGPLCDIVQDNARYNVVVGYYQKCVNKRDFDPNLSFNQFNIQFNINMDKITRVFSYKIENQMFVSNQEVQIGIGSWAYEPVKKCSLKANQQIYVPSDKYLTIYRDTFSPIIVTPQTLQVDISMIQHGIQVSKGGAPIRNLLVISQKDNVIQQVTYTDRSGRARCSGSVTIYESINNFVTL
ncbi:hypothetical protein SS50377_27621 [Spironucleus salmonicida]|uniref:Uncharacterized protein n=1 Tax=Spironucleus salmonicida TaxID=348837 RepID=V6LSC4_9EUKA|nr:hypothetical protein SS50377_27621 [Spironucleus salmonicida]|eukprot:EST46601.1 Hypothetical protein SS50377_13405 [Spironucleus salmonicida]